MKRRIIETKSSHTVKVQFMTSSKNEYSSNWANDETIVTVPFSVAGVGTMIVIESKFTGKKMLLDVGDGTTRDLFQQLPNSSVEDLTLIAITHGHFDHMGGLYSLLGFLRMLHRKSPLDIIMPQGSIEVLGIIESFREFHPSTIPFDIRCHEMKDGVEFNADFFRVKGFEVEHFDSDVPTSDIVWQPALGYRVTIGDTIVAYTGDTRMCANLENIVESADLALIESTYRTIPESDTRAHLSREEAEQLATLAKDHIIIHQVPDWVK